MIAGLLFFACKFKVLGAKRGIGVKSYLQIMKLTTIILLNLLAFSSGFAQQSQAPVKLKFCGYKYKDTALLRRQFEQQLAFLQIREGDTIVDIGTSSGAYIGAMNVVAAFKNVHFILVDIDSSCLNSTKLHNMLMYYEGLKGVPFSNTFSLVLNTTDSLWLPPNSKKKLWIMNTLHEIPDKTGMIWQMSTVLQRGGEVIIAELMATEKHTIHQGCRDPLMTEEEIKRLMTDNGFVFKEILTNPIPAVKKRKNPYYLFRFEKL